MLIVSAWTPQQPRTGRRRDTTVADGVTVHDDWDNIGQRQTDSGRVSSMMSSS